MNFIVDAQLPKLLSDFLNGKAHKSIYTIELDHLNKTSDSIITELADKENRLVITNDYDFLQLHIIANKPSKLLFVKTGNISNRNYLNFLKSTLEKL